MKMINDIYTLAVYNLPQAPIPAGLFIICAYAPLLVNIVVSMQCYYITNHQITLKQQAYLSPLMFSHITDCIPYGKHTHYLSFNCSKPVAD